VSTGNYRRRTAITRLSVSEEDDERLQKTVSAWLEGCNVASELAWDVADSPSAVQRLTYDRVREATGLGSQHAILAARHVARAIKSGIERRLRGRKASRPEFTSRSMTFDARTMTVFTDRKQVSLTTADDGPRVRADLVLPADEDGYQYRYLDSDEWEVTESTLHHRDGEWFLHLGFRKPATDEPTIENGTVLGVDFGVAQIAVTSTARFFSAGELNHRRREFERVRADLQARDTRGARRTLERLSGRETEYVKHVLHQVANGIVEEALDHECDGIVLEALEGIRERLPKANWHSTWAFDTLQGYVTYKAEAEGLFVETTDPRHTSQRCPECGFTHEDNRPARGRFECRACGCAGHADYVAAKNVAATYLRRDRQSSRRRGVGQYALKSGTITPVTDPTVSTDESNPDEARAEGSSERGFGS